ncbi:hypothetical protein PSHT_02321 [Puccinia striiformis]|uniref:Uncharacterized protein n=1 Tax=Puccinia striiformis TaxID=27350 RepID=A0A2S4WIA1_9BASI|nr:hypothetical protein PSHT_02321 [Puccinia striiformis]
MREIVHLQTGQVLNFGRSSPTSMVLLPMDNTRVPPISSLRESACTTMK